MFIKSVNIYRNNNAAPLFMLFSTLLYVPMLKHIISNAWTPKADAWFCTCRKSQLNQWQYAHLHEWDLILLFFELETSSATRRKYTQLPISNRERHTSVKWPSAFCEWTKPRQILLNQDSTRKKYLLPGFTLKLSREASFTILLFSKGPQRACDRVHFCADKARVENTCIFWFQTHNSLLP